MERKLKMVAKKGTPLKKKRNLKMAIKVKRQIKRQMTQAQIKQKKRKMKVIRK